MNFGTGLAVSAFAALNLAACQPEPKPAQETKQALSPQIVVEVGRDGTILLNGERVTQDELEKRLEALPVEGADVQLHPDNEATYDDIARTMAVIQRTGHIKRTVVLGGT